MTDLVATPLATREAAIDIAAGPVPTLTWLVETIDALLDEVGRAREDVIAIGIGVPGPVEFSTGRPANPPIMPGWDGFDVPAWLRAHVPAHVLVDNDVNIAALGERGHGWSGVDHLLFVKVATGIGSGIVSDGALQRGAQGTAGDIGHVRVSRAGGRAVPLRQHRVPRGPSPPVPRSPVPSGRRGTTCTRAATSSTW